MAINYSGREDKMKNSILTSDIARTNPWYFVYKWCRGWDLNHCLQNIIFRNLSIFEKIGNFAGDKATFAGVQILPSPRDTK
jgi:hypothetical protein